MRTGLFVFTYFYLMSISFGQAQGSSPSSSPFLPLAVSSSCPTCTFIGQNNTPSSVGASGDVLSKALKYLPSNSLTKGITEYVNTVDPKGYQGDAAVGANNQGLRKYFGNRFSDPRNSCVRDAAVPFFEEMSKVLRNKTPQKSNCRPTTVASIGGVVTAVGPNYGCNKIGRSTLKDVAGEGEYASLEPGWLWKLALKHAKGDTNSAMFLIGMCGHDDVVQGGFFYQDSSAAGQDELRELVSNLKVFKKSMTDRLKVLAQDPDANAEAMTRTFQELSMQNQMIQSLESQKGMARNMPCPPKDSGFYVPESLGKDADIPKDLKEEIKKIQSADGARNIPGKHYHVYGAAFMACQLIQNGMSPTAAALTQKQAARLYRGIRMCDSVTKIDSSSAAGSEELLKQYQATGQKDLVLKLIQNVKTNKLTCVPNSTGTGYSNPECNLLMATGLDYGVVKFNDIAESLIDSKIKNSQLKQDAADLYKSWYVGGGSIMGKKIPCSDMRVWGPADLMNPTDSFFKPLEQPRGWSKERYQAASQKLATWDVDFKWTIAQHEAGSQFAGKNCRPRMKNEKPLRGICPGGPPDGTNAYQMGMGLGAGFGVGQPMPAESNKNGTR